MGSIPAAGTQFLAIPIAGDTLPVWRFLWEAKNAPRLHTACVV